MQDQYGVSLHFYGLQNIGNLHLGFNFRTMWSNSSLSRVMTRIKPSSFHRYRVIWLTSPTTNTHRTFAKRPSYALTLQVEKCWSARWWLFVLLTLKVRSWSWQGISMRVSSLLFRVVFCGKAMLRHRFRLCSPAGFNCCGRRTKGHFLQRRELHARCSTEVHDSILQATCIK